MSVINDLIEIIEDAQDLLSQLDAADLNEFGYGLKERIGEFEQNHGPIWKLKHKTIFNPKEV